MKTIVVKTQAEWDALPKAFSEWTEIEIHSSADILIEIRTNPDSSNVTAYDSSNVKRVSKDFKTQEQTANETLWTIGETLTHLKWEPKAHECGAGKFHACAHPIHCDKYRTETGDRYIAIKVALKDTYVWKNGEHPNKIAFRNGTVLHECDVNGKKKDRTK